MGSPGSKTGGESDDSAAARFTETRWSVVVSAAGKNGSSRAASSLEQLCSVYWRPLYAYIRRQGESPHDAQDLTQEFFARLLSKDYLASVDQSKGRFRSFLLASLKHFLSNERDKARAQKRGGRQAAVPLDFADAETHCGFQPADPLTPEKVFERRWATALLEQALLRLRAEYSEAGKEELFERIKTTLTENRGSVAYARLSAGLGLSEAAVKMAVHRLRRSYRAAVRAEIAETVGDASEVEDELREVMRALGS